MPAGAWQAGASGAALTQDVLAGEVGGERSARPWACPGGMKPTPHAWLKAPSLRWTEGAVIDFQGAFPLPADAAKEGKSIERRQGHPETN